jgi:hypothetical protein
VNIDPVRVLREHWKAIAAGGVVGAVLGTILNYGMGAVYPLYTGEAVFEIRNRILEGTDAVGQDYTQEEQVVRIANTEIGFMLSDRVLESVIAAPAFQQTSYGQLFLENGVPNYTDAIRELKEDLSASFARSSQLFVLRFMWTEKEDIAPVLNTVGETYMTLRVADENKRITSGNESMRTRSKAIETELNTIDEQIKSELRKAGIQSYDEDPQKGQRALEALLLRRAEVIQQIQLTQSRLEAARARKGGTGMGTEEEVREARVMRPSRHFWSIVTARRPRMTRSGPVSAKALPRKRKPRSRSTRSSSSSRGASPSRFSRTASPMRSASMTNSRRSSRR